MVQKRIIFLLLVTLIFDNLGISQILFSEETVAEVVAAGNRLSQQQREFKDSLGGSLWDDLEDEEDLNENEEDTIESVVSHFFKNWLNKTFKAKILVQRENRFFLFPEGTLSNFNFYKWNNFYKAIYLAHQSSVEYSPNLY